MWTLEQYADVFPALGCTKTATLNIETHHPFAEFLSLPEQHKPGAQPIAFLLTAERQAKTYLEKKS
jgi:hypothetical protein